MQKLVSLVELVAICVYKVTGRPCMIQDFSCIDCSKLVELADRHTMSTFGRTQLKFVAQSSHPTRAHHVHENGVHCYTDAEPMLEAAMGHTHSGETAGCNALRVSPGYAARSPIQIEREGH